ncbi:hypothetical protein PIROE2DRAFT_15900 [Piromyces sp. E2]|nr:hypothetical protein PIROE2DRAFT_15900 [Piromyces sp. E2]|eukprot:OUM58747.1 hypothetical protein PIROE2DRAFT_15900 [Piromyces sp. E2]
MDVEENTKLFYAELNSNFCDPEKLKKLSSKGIFLYKPLFRYKNIKYHEYAVDINNCSLVYLLFIDNFYLKISNNFKNIIKYIDINSVVQYMVEYFGRDIYALDYLINIFNINSNITCRGRYRQKEDFLNTVYSDISLFYIKKDSNYRNNKYWYEKYNILVEDEFEYIILNLNKFNINEFYDKIDVWDIHANIEDLCFNNNDLFTIENKMYYSNFPNKIYKYEAEEMLHNLDIGVNYENNILYVFLNKEESPSDDADLSEYSRESRVFCHYNHQGISKVYDPTYFDKKGNVVYAKTIEEYAKVLGPTWFGVSWCGNNTMVNSIGNDNDGNNDNKDENIDNYLTRGEDTLEEYRNRTTKYVEKIYDDLKKSGGQCIPLTKINTNKLEYNKNTNIDNLSYERDTDYDIKEILYYKYCEIPNSVNLVNELEDIKDVENIKGELKERKRNNSLLKDYLGENESFKMIFYKTFEKNLKNKLYEQNFGEIITSKLTDKNENKKEDNKNIITNKEEDIIKNKIYIALKDKLEVNK